MRVLIIAAFTCVASVILCSRGDADEGTQQGASISGVLQLPVDDTHHLVSEAELQSVVVDLGSSSFVTRRTAFLKIWNMGASALPVLAAAQPTQVAENENRQLMENLATLQLLLKLGIKPGSSNDSRKLVELLNDLHPQKIVEICKLGHWELATQLVKDNRALHAALSDDYGRYSMNLIVEAAYQQGDLQQAWPIIVAVTPAGQTAWMANKLQYEIPSEGMGDDERALQLFYRGEVDAALELATSPSTRIPMLTRSFRWSAFAEEETQRMLVGATPGPAHMAARAVLYEIGGNVAQSDALWDKILEPTPSDLQSAELNSPEDGLDETEEATPQLAPEAPPLDLQSRVALRLLGELSNPTRRFELNQFITALIMSGRIAPVEQFMASLPNSAEGYSFYAARNAYGLAFEQVGLSRDLSNFDAWLGAKGELLSSKPLRSNRTELDLVARVAAALVGLGHTDKAAMAIDMLAEITPKQNVLNDPETQSVIWQGAILRWLSRHESRMLCLKMAERHFDGMVDDCQRIVLSELFEELGDVALKLFDSAPQIADHPLDSNWIKLEKLRVWDREYFGADADVTIANWLRTARQNIAPEDLTPDHLARLADLANNFGLDDLARELLSTDLREVRGLGALNMHWLEAAEMFNEQLEPESALPLLESLREHGFNMQTAYVCEVEALVMTGEYDRAALLNQSRWLRPLAAERVYAASYADVAQHYEEREQIELAMEYAEPAYQLADTSSRFFYFAGSRYARLAEEQKDYLLSANIQRAALVEALKPQSDFVQYMVATGFTSSIRYSAQQERLARAIACIDQGDIEAARRHLELSHRLQPQDIEVVVQCFPRLVKAGEHAFADELFDQYEAELRAQIAAWPSDATALNNLAWMYSQCDRKLDEALDLAKRGVALAPSSPVFLDTLAEVEFRLGKVERALVSMRGCVQLDPRDSHYRENLVRFRQGR
ncbi:MAG: hypothetical protein R3C53_13660 [Pirellulaceae bacterium]